MLILDENIGNPLVMPPLALTLLTVICILKIPLRNSVLF